MIRRIVKLFLKLNNEWTRRFILFVVGVFITLAQVELINTNSNSSILASDIIILTYGGLEADYNIVNDIFSFILWIAPHIFIFLMLNLSVINRVESTSKLVLTRVKNKNKWFYAYNIAIGIKVIEYYLILFLSTLLVCMMKFGYKAFEYTSYKGIINQLNTNCNQYLIILWVFVLSISAMIGLQIFINTLYYCIKKSKEVAIAGIIFSLIPIFFKVKPYGIYLVNYAMFRRFEVFKDGLNDINMIRFKYFICIFIIINLKISLSNINKKDIDKI